MNNKCGICQKEQVELLYWNYKHLITVGFCPNHIHMLPKEMLNDLAITNPWIKKVKDEQ